MARQQLPPQIKKIKLDSGAIRYELIVDIGIDPDTGKRRQKRKRCLSEDEAKEALAKLSHEVKQGTYVPDSDLTVEQACSDWLAGKRIRGTTSVSYVHALQPLRDRHGELPAQKLSKRHLDDLVTDLLAGGKVPKGRDKMRKAWKPETVNATLDRIETMLASLVDEGKLVRNVAALVDRVPSKGKRVMATFTEAEVRKLLAAADKDRKGHAWHLALCGLRRGEIGGLRWTDVNLEAGTLAVENSRVSVNGEAVEGDPKSDKSIRALPLTPTLKQALRKARKTQLAEKLALGEAYGPGTHVLCNEAGHPYHPDTISDYWDDVVKVAKVRRIRLHDARHTCATLMHLQHVPIAVIAAWLGHSDSAFTQRTYVHSQDSALKAAAATLEGVVTSRDNNASVTPRRKKRRSG